MTTAHFADFGKWPRCVCNVKVNTRIYMGVVKENGDRLLIGDMQKTEYLEA